MKKILSLIFIFLYNFIFSQCLNGVYTIGGSSPSFTSIGQAVNTLSVNGVCGPVTFNIRNGIYNEKTTIPNVVGTSSVNTITFQSESFDSSSVIIQSTGTSTQNYVFNLLGTRNIYFKYLTLKNSSTTYQTVFNLGNNIYDFNLENSVIEVPVTSSSFPNANRYVISAYSSSNLYSRGIIQNCKITGGQIGFIVNTASCNPSGRWKLINNYFLNQYEKAVELLGVYDSYILSNQIKTNTSYTDYVSVILSSCGGQTIFSKNMLFQTQGTGILFSQATSSINSQITNNLINVLGTGNNDAGIYIEASSDCDVIHNTVLVNNTDATSECVAISMANNINVKNNIFLSQGNGSVYYKSLGSTNIAFDYNCVKSTSASFARISSSNIANFSDWQLQNFDLNSLNFYPTFVSPVDFHILTDFSQNLILPYFPNVPDDIEGTLRDTYSPYFGAYEFYNSINVNDASVSKIYKPINCIGNNSVNILLKNYGTNVLNNAKIGWSVNGVLQPIFNWTGNLSYYDTISVNIGSYNFQDLDDNNVKIWTYLPNAASDQYLINDTVTSVLKTAMSGTYTIGGASPNFIAISTAISQLVDRGMCGDVTFNIRDGYYQDTIYLPILKKVNSNLKLTLQSESGIAGNTSLVAQNNKKAVVVNGAEHVKISKININGSNSISAVTIYGGKDLEVSDCAIYGAFQGSLTTASFKKLKIFNNVIFGQMYTLVLGGTNNFRFTDVDVSNNQLSSYFGSGNIITLQYIDTLRFDSNIIPAGSLGSQTSFSYITDFMVKNNSVKTINSLCMNFDNSLNGKIFNNMVVSSGSSNYSLVQFNNVSNTYILNNSFNTTNTNALASVLSFSFCNAIKNKVANNIIQNSGPGSLIKLQNVGQPYFRNNCYNFTGSIFGYRNGIIFQNLTNWKNIVLTDTNSFQVNPWFVSSSDLHANNIDLRKAGVSISGIFNNDYDGQLRDTLTPDVGADEFLPVSIDAAISSFNFNSLLCAGTNPIQVLLKNNGTSILTSAKLFCKINSTTLPVLNWSGSLASGSQTLVTIANYNFNVNSSFSIKAWSSLPNNTTDILNNNDTIYQNFSSAGLSGVYTIGGSSPTFTSIGSAINALKNGGVCGPVIFNIRDGIYNEQIKIPNIKGVSSLNTILFQSQSLDSSLVSIEYSGNSVLNYVVNVDSVDYITFYKLGFKALNSSYANILTFSNKALHMQIKNCFFNGQPSNGTLIYMPYTCDSSSIYDNRFSKGSSGVSLYSSCHKILNNYFEDQSIASIDFSGSGLDCLSNQFKYFSFTGNAMSIYGSLTGKVTVSKNKISYVNGPNVNAINISNCGSSLNPVFVTNNFISLNGTTTGVTIQNSQYTNFLHNSIYQNGGGKCLIYYAVTNSVIKNNIFYDSTGVCVFTSTNNSSFTSNYNCFYSPTFKLAQIASVQYYSLNTYSLATNLEANSIVINPLYNSYNDLHISICSSINDKGDYNALVQDDIDGDLRDNSHPDIGADEFSFPYSLVWPGDANSDGAANNIDVLQLGLNYVQTGTPRATIDNTWQAFYANNWSTTMLNCNNVNHSDCNGDGIINDNDTLAIFNNYGLTHAFKPSQTNTVNPQLSIVPDQVSVLKGTWGTASIYLGDASTNINNINGVAFTVDFDNTLIEPSNIWIEYLPSFIDASQNLHFRKLDFANSKLFAATTHTINNNVSGNGLIAKLHYQIKSNLTTDEVLNIGLSQANQSNASGLITPLTSGTGTLMALGANVGLQELNNNIINLSPNPTNGSLIIKSKTELQKIEVISVDGKILFNEIPTNVTHTLHLENLSNGIYFVNLYQNDRVVKREKIVLNK